MPKSFDETCEAFTRACVQASDWKQNQFGAAYATRIRKAIAELKTAIAEAEQHPEIGT